MKLAGVVKLIQRNGKLFAIFLDGGYDVFSLGEGRCVKGEWTVNKRSASGIKEGWSSVGWGFPNGYNCMAFP